MIENNQYSSPGAPVPPPQIPPKICRKCKAQIGKGLKVCPYCGKKQGLKPGCLGAAGIAVGVIILLYLLTSCVNSLTGGNRKAPEETSVTTTITETTTPAATVTETEPPTTELPGTEPPAPETENTTKAEPGTSTQEVIDAVNSGDYSLVTPEFKEVMDSYEAFYDQYIAFMNKYTSGEDDTMSMLNDYMALTNQMKEWSDKIDAIDESTLSPADDAYYLLVTLRIEQKLLGAAYSLEQ